MPFVVTFELSNLCNARCGVCRTPDGRIIDRNPNNNGQPIRIGNMPPEMFFDAIDQMKKDLMMAVLYVNGEPLLYEHLYRVIRYASDRKVATMISTNGFLLSETVSRKLLDSGLDFIKIAISGFSRETARIQHRTGDIERVKKEVETLVRLNRDGKYSVVIMLDYISYRYNDHELPQARRFCEEQGIIFNVRPGIYMGVDAVEPPPIRAPREQETSLCDWPWKMATIDWDGKIVTCCDLTMWSGAPSYGMFIPGQTRLASLWNGPKVMTLRKLHSQKGRGAIPACAKCHRKGTAFTL